MFGAVISLVPRPMRKILNGPGDEASAVMCKLRERAASLIAKGLCTAAS